MKGWAGDTAGLRQPLALLSLAVLGGASFLFIRVAAPEFGPFALMAARVLMAGLVLVVVAKATGQMISFRAYWPRYLVLGALYGAIPYSLIATASLHIPASLSAVLNATTPLFTAVVASAWVRERLSVRTIVGLALGLTGVSITVGWAPASLSAELIPWTVCMLLSSLFYALGSVYAKKALQGVPPIAVAIGQQFGAGVFLLPVALASWPERAPSGEAVLALVVLALLATAVTSLVFFSLVARIGPTKTLSVLFLVPFFGLVFGHLFLAEPVGLTMLAGLIIILSGVLLTVGSPKGARGAGSVTKRGGL